MSISGQNLSIVIVTLKSEKVIHDCIKSINLNLPIIVVEQSKNRNFKDELENKYKNLKCILSNSNLGMGSGNNIGIKAADTDYVMILNPDTVLKSDTIEELIFAAKSLPNFEILAPLEEDFSNYEIHSNKEKIDLNLDQSPFQVDYVDGFAMLLNKKKLKDEVYFDKNFFMYLENNDLCLRTRKNGGKIFIAPKSRIKHLAAKAVDEKFSIEVEYSRNWHWIWSKFYFNKKHYGYIKALKECLPTYLSSMIKFIFYFLINNKMKKKIYFNRASGFYNAFIGRSSWYRPTIPTD